MAESDGAFLEEFRDDERKALAGLEFAVVVGRFYEDLARRLVHGAHAGFQMAGVAPQMIREYSVPGAFELPFAAQSLIEGASRQVGVDTELAGIACLGVVIRGETDHYDFVCSEAARGIQEVQLRHGVPCAFGVITCDNMEQALARCGGGKRDQGRNSALTVARMALLKRQLA